MRFLDIMLLVLIGILFLKSHFLEEGKENIIFDRDTTSSLRGIAMLGIILHHIHNRFGYKSLILSQTGYLTTGLFFFISGFGNLISINKKEKTDFKWILRKFLKIYVPFLTVYCIYYLSDYIMFKDKVPGFKECITDLVTISLPNEINWFPKIIVICFAVQWILKKFFKSIKIQIIAQTVIWSLYILIMYKIGQPSYWFNSVFCYALGGIVSYFKQQINENLKDKHRYIYFSVSVIIFFILLLKNTENVKILCATIFSIMVYLYSSIFSFKTKFLAWIGNNSFEFYLFHVACLQVFSGLILINKPVYAACVLISAVISVYLYLKIKAYFTKIK